MALSNPVMRYGPHTRLGNWAEDESNRDLAAKDYEAKRARGELLHLKKAREKAFQCQRVPHTFAADGLVRYGDSVQLRISFPGGGKFAGPWALSCNVFEETAPGLVRITAGSSCAAEARNVFVVESCGGPSGGAAGEPVRYGDRIALVSNPALTVDVSTGVVGMQFLLHSQRANNIIGAGRRGRQEADMSVRRSAETEWLVTSPAGDALAAEGAPVRAGEPLALLHAMSGTLLAGDPAVRVEGGFGVELDVHLNTVRANTHTSMGHGGELPPVAAQPQNCWTFALSGDAEAGVDARDYRPLTAEALLERARSLLAERAGLHGARSLSVALSALDERGTGVVPASLVQVALAEHGVALTEAEFRLLLAPFDAAASGGGMGGSMGGSAGGSMRGGGGASPAHARGGRPLALSTAALLGALRGGSGTYSEARREAAQAAFDHTSAQLASGRLPVHPYLAGIAAPGLAGLTPTTGVYGAATLSGSGPQRIGGGGASGLTVAAVKGAFDAKFDPRVRAGRMTATEAAHEFSRQWPHHHKPSALVDARAWHAYYADVSALVPDDFEFCAMVADVWHVPGRGSWKTKASKRVSVTFFKGTSADVVIPEAEDIPDDDLEGLTVALKALGFGGIARVKVLETIEIE